MKQAKTGKKEQWYFERSLVFIFMIKHELVLYMSSNHKTYIMLADSNKIVE